MTTLLLTVAITLPCVYVALVAVAGTERDAPLWLHWPALIWNRMSHDWRRPRPALVHPDHAKIARLERELGMGRESS